MIRDNGNLPNSPYSITCGVLCLTFKIYFMKSVCTFSIIERSPNPRTSDPYVKIGTMVLSKSFNWQSIGRSKFLIFRYSPKRAFLVCFTTCFFFVWEKLLVLGKSTPKYLKLSTTSIGCSLKLKARWRDLWPKITIFDFSGLTLSFHLTQFDWNSLSSCCNFSSLSANKLYHRHIVIQLV